MRTVGINLRAEPKKRKPEIERELDMSSGGGVDAVRLHEQLRSVWKRRLVSSADCATNSPSTRGYLLLPGSCGEGGEKREREVSERWFALIGHCFFYTMHRDSPEFSGALLADIFGSATPAENDALESLSSSLAAAAATAAGAQPATDSLQVAR